LSLILASSNPGKLKEFHTLLAPVIEVVPADERAPFVVEDGSSYQENALKKAQAYHKVYSCTVLADDSGLEIDVLHGAPGIFSARFGGEGISWNERFKKLYQELKTFPPKTWTARFRCVLCLYLKDSPPIFFEGVCEGMIVPSAQGHAGFGYDPIFFSSELKKTFGQAKENEKGLISHRARACFAVKRWAEKNLHKLT